MRYPSIVTALSLAAVASSGCGSNGKPSYATSVAPSAASSGDDSASQTGHTPKQASPLLSSELRNLPATKAECKNVVGSFAEPRPTSEGETTVFGLVVLNKRIHQAGSRRPDGMQFAKTGLIFRNGGASFDLIVANPSSARLDWGLSGSGGGTRRLQVPSCKGGDVRPTPADPPQYGGIDPDAPWFVFAGGYRVHEPTCVDLIVRAGHREELVRVGVGTNCPD